MIFRQSSRTQQCTIILLLSAIILIPFLSLSYVFQASEAREGSVVQEILRSGNFIFPLRNGDIVPSKPLLFHWISAGLAMLLGQFNEFVLRFPSALAAIGAVLVIFLFLKKLVSDESAYIGALIMLSTYVFVHLAQDGRVDMVHSLFVWSAICYWIYCFATESHNGKHPEKVSGRAYSVVAILCGLASLAKGPVGFVIPVIVICSTVCVECGIAKLNSVFRIQWLWGIAVILPWYLSSAYFGGDSFIARQLLFENISRFVGGDGITVKPFWFYLVHFWGQLAPWSVLLAAFGCLFLRKKERAALGKTLSNWKTRFTLRAGITWLVSILVFISLSSGKRRAYLLIVVPAVCIILSVIIPFFKNSVEKWLHRQRKNKSVFWIPIAVLLIIAGCFTILVEGCSWEILSGVVSTDVGRATLQSVCKVGEGSLLLAIYFVGFVNCVINFYYLAIKAKSGKFLFLSWFCFAELVLIVFVNFGIAVKSATHTYADFAQQVHASLPEDKKLTIVKKLSDESLEGFLFYFDKRVKMQSPREVPAQPGYYLVRKSWLEQSGYKYSRQFDQIIEGGRIVDEDAERLILIRAR